MTQKPLSDVVVGNIVPLPGQFDDDLSLNLDKMKLHLEWLLEQGVGNVYLALSASEFEWMTREERLQVVSLVVKTVAGRATVLAQPVGAHWIDDLVEEARIMGDLGADVLVVKLLDIKTEQKFFSSRYRKRGYAPESHDPVFLEWLDRIGRESGRPLILHDKPFRGFPYLEQVMALDCVAGIKTHEEDPWTRRKIYSRYGGESICFDGMGKTNQFWSLLWGARARHTCWSWFDPSTDRAFTESVLKGDLASATAIVEREWPLVDAILSTGFRGYKAVMGLLGLPTGPVRIPGESLSSEELEAIRKALIQIDLLKN